MAKIEIHEIKNIKRSQINLADYNPRNIDDEARKRLKKGLKKYGLVSSLTWNEITGNLVSGHQRLSIMDEIEKYPNNDYDVRVSVVRLELKDEMALNVQMNNSSMQGDFDNDALFDMMEAGANILDMGFSDFDLELVFGDDVLSDIFDDDENVVKSKNTLDDIKKDRKEMVAKQKAQNSASFYFVVVCESEAERESVFKQMGVPFHEEFVTMSHVKRLLD